MGTERRDRPDEGADDEPSEHVPEFPGDAEEAFSSTHRVFGTEFSVPLQRFGDMPAGPGAPELSEEERSR